MTRTLVPASMRGLFQSAGSWAEEEDEEDEEPCDKDGRLWFVLVEVINEEDAEIAPEWEPPTTDDAGTIAWGGRAPGTRTAGELRVLQMRRHSMLLLPVVLSLLTTPRALIALSTRLSTLTVSARPMESSLRKMASAWAAL